MSRHSSTVRARRRRLTDLEVAWLLVLTVWVPVITIIGTHA